MGLKQAHVVSRTMDDAVHPNDPFLNGVEDKIILHNEETISHIGQFTFIGDFAKQRIGGKAG